MNIEITDAFWIATVLALVAYGVVQLAEDLIERIKRKRKK